MKHRFVQDDPSRVSTVKHDVQLIERKLAVAEYQTLRAAVGWPEVADEAVARGLAGDLFSVAAELDGHTIGCARVVGDGGIYLYVQDVIVLPPHQGRGIGKCLMDRVIAFVDSVSGHHTTVALMAAKGVVPFYEKYGFVTRPADGPGMYRLWS